MPQGIYNNSNEKYVRRYIKSKARIIAVIGLHGNSFKPHTGTKTSLLFIRKYKDNVENDYPIFFATSKLTFKDNSGEYRFLQDEKENVAHDKNKNPIYFTDLTEIAAAFEGWAKARVKEGDDFLDFINN